MTIPSIREEFEGAELGDVRRTRRMQQVSEAMARDPGGSIPALTGGEAGLEGCYRLLNNEAVTPEAVLAPHQRQTRLRAGECRETLVIHDTTEFRFADDDSREGLGPLLHKTGGRGFFAHMSLALSPEREPLGVVGIHTYVRSSTHVSKKKSKRIMSADNECRRFALLVDTAEEVLAGHTTPIHVIDREADIYELFERMVQMGRRFVIRLSDDRATPERIEGTRAHVKLSDVLSELEGIVEREVALSRRPDAGRSTAKSKAHPAREGRIATLSFRATRVTIRRPDDVPEPVSASVVLNLVHVLEKGAPEGQQPVEWRLLTTEPIDTAEQVLRVVDHYRARWTIEEYFKCLKTGCAFESRQFRSYDALCRLLAVMAAVAWRLLRIRTVATKAPERPASDVLTPSQLAVLIATSTRIKLPPQPTARQAMLAIAGIGGHLKRNGDPGWITLGRGFDTLLERERGYLAARAEM